MSSFIGSTFPMTAEQTDAVTQGESLNSTWRVLCLMLFMWLLLAFTVVQIANSVERVFLLLGIVTALILPLAYQQIREGLDLFEPLVFANLALASMFLGRPLFDISTNNWFDFWFSTIFDVAPGFNIMLKVALIGIVGFQLGYLSPIPRKIAALLPNFSAGINLDRAVIIAVGMFLIGLSLFAGYVVQSGGLGFLLTYVTSRELGAAGYSYKTASGYLFIGPLFWPPAGLITFSAWIQSRKRSHLWLTILIMTMFFGVNLGSGSRSIIIQGVIGLASVWYVARNKRPGIFLLLSSAVVSLFLFSYSREARTVVSFSDKIAVLNHMAADPEKSIISIWSQDDAAMSDYLSEIVANIPTRLPFSPFSTIKDILLRAYPRFLWPSNKKPDEHTVVVFKFLFKKAYYRAQSTAACSQIGEFYVDYGSPAVLIGMFILGITLGVAKPWFSLAGRSLPAQLLYVVMPAFTINVMRGGLPSFIIYMVITAFPIVLLQKFAKAI